MNKFEKAVISCDDGSLNVKESQLGKVVLNLALPVDSVASGLKLFFSKLPQPLIPHIYHDTFMRSSTDLSNHKKFVAQLETLPLSNYITLKCLLSHLKL